MVVHHVHLVLRRVPACRRRSVKIFNSVMPLGISDSDPAKPEAECSLLSQQMSGVSNAPLVVVVYVKPVSLL